MDWSNSSNNNSKGSNLKLRGKSTKHDPLREVLLDTIMDAERNHLFDMKNYPMQESFISLSRLKFCEIFNLMTDLLREVEMKSEKRYESPKHDCCVLNIFYKFLRKNMDQLCNAQQERVKECIRSLYKIYNGEIPNLCDPDVEMLSCKCLRLLSRKYLDPLLSLIMIKLNSMIKDDDEEIQHNVSSSCIDLRIGDIQLFLTQFYTLWERRKGSKTVILWKVGKTLKKWLENYPEELDDHMTNPSPSLTAIATTWFTILSKASDQNKSRVYVWPLLTVIMFLIPESLSTLSSLKNTTKIANKYPPFMINVKKIIDCGKGTDYDSATMTAVVFCMTNLSLNPNKTKNLSETQDFFLNHLMNIYMNYQKATSNLSDILTEKFLVDIFKILFWSGRLDFDKLELFQNLHDSVQIMTIRSIVEMVSAKRKMEWWPEPTILINQIKLREKFMEAQLVLCCDMREAHVMKETVISNKKKIKDNFSDSGKVTFYWMLSIFEKVPSTLFGNSEESVDNVFQTLVTTLYKFVAYFPVATISIKASQVLLNIHKVEYMKRWFKNDPKQSSIIISSVSSDILTRDYSENYICNILTWFKNLYKLKFSTFEEMPSLRVLEKVDDEMIISVRNLEFLLYAVSWIGNPILLNLCIECFYWLAIEIEWLEEFIDDSIVSYDILSMAKVFKNIGTLAEKASTYAGSEKGCRLVPSILKLANPASGMMCRAFNTGLVVFGSLLNNLEITLSVNLPVLDIPQIITNYMAAIKTNETFILLFRNLFSFLTSICGSVAQANSKNQNVNIFIECIIELYSKSQKEKADATACITLPIIRENLVESHYSKVFEQFYQSLKLFASNNPKKFGCLYRNSLCIIHKFFQNDIFTASVSTTVPEFDANYFLRLIVEPQKYCQTIIITSELWDYILFIVLQMLLKKEDISLHSDPYVQHIIVKNVFKFIQNYEQEGVTNEIGSFHGLQKEFRNERNFSTLSMLFKGFFDDFKIIPSYINCEGSYMSRTDILKKIFETLSNMLKCNVQDANFSTNMVLAMSKLVYSNIDLGYEYLITLIKNNEHEDNRHHFISILCQVYRDSHYTDIHGNNEISLVDTYIEKAIIYSSDGKFPFPEFVLFKMCPPSVIDDIMTLFIEIFQKKKKLYDFTCSIFMKEVESDESYQTIFRSNSVPVMLLTHCLKLYTQEFTDFLLLPVIKFLTSNTQLSYEIDPHKLGKADNIEINRSNLLRLCTCFFDNFYFICDYIPDYMKIVCSSIYSAIVKRFEDSASAVVSIFFLRMVNPALISKINSFQNDSDRYFNLKRAVTLLSKILQNGANQIFSAKESYMNFVAPLLKKNMHVFEKFQRNLIDHNINETSYNSKLEVHSHLKMFSLKMLLTKNINELDEFTKTTDNDEALGQALRTVSMEINKNSISMLTGSTISVCTNNVSISSLNQFCDSLSFGKEYFEKYLFGKNKHGNDVLYFPLAKVRNASKKESNLGKFFEMFLGVIKTQSWELIMDGDLFCDIPFLARYNSLSVIQEESSVVTRGLREIYFYRISESTLEYLTYTKLIGKYVSVQQRHYINSLTDLITKYNIKPTEEYENIIKNSNKLVFNGTFRGYRSAIDVRDGYLIISYSLQYVKEEPVKITDSIKLSSVSWIQENNSETLTVYMERRSYIITCDNLRKLITNVKEQHPAITIRASDSKEITGSDQDISSGKCLAIAFFSLFDSSTMVQARGCDLLKSICLINCFDDANSILSKMNTWAINTHKNQIFELSEALSTEAKSMYLGFLNGSLDYFKSVDQEDISSMIICLKYWMKHLGNISKLFKERNRLPFIELLENFLILSLKTTGSACLIQELWDVIFTDHILSCDCWEIVSKKSWYKELSRVQIVQFGKIMKRVGNKDPFYLSNLLLMINEVMSKDSTDWKTINIDWEKVNYFLILIEELVSDSFTYDSASFVEYYKLMNILLMLAPIEMMSSLISCVSLIAPGFVRKMENYKPQLHDDKLNVMEEKLVDSLANFYRYRTEHSMSTNETVLDEEWGSCFRKIITLMQNSIKLAKVVSNIDYPKLIEDNYTELAFHSDCPYNAIFIFLFGMSKNEFSNNDMKMIYGCMSKLLKQRNYTSLNYSLVCLQEIHRIIPVGSDHHFIIFTICIVLLEVKEKQIFYSILKCMKKYLLGSKPGTIITKDLKQSFNDRLDQFSVSTVFLQLNKLVGLNITEFFNYAICSLLHRAQYLENKDAISCVTSILMFFIRTFSDDFNSPKVNSVNIPFIISSMYLDEEAMALVLSRFNFNEYYVLSYLNPDKLKKMFRSIDRVDVLPTTKHAMLLVSLLVTVFDYRFHKNADYMELLFLLASYVTKYPNSLSICYNQLILLLIECTSKNNTILQSVLIQEMEEAISSCISQENTRIGNLSNIGFHGFLTCFTNFIEDETTTLSFDYASSVCSLFAKHDYNKI